MKAITSFSDAGYELYGRDFLDSWRQHASIPLTIYNEGNEYPGFENRCLWDIPGCQSFVANAPQVDDWRFDAKKFGRKAWAQLDALQEKGIILWFDADSIITDTIDEAFISNLIGPYISYMGRPDFHPCTSFVAWNTEHADHPKFFDLYKSMWHDYKVFEIPEWHDAFVFEWCRKQSGVASKNLCEGRKFRLRSDNVFDDVIPGHHKKGSRKFGAKGG